MQIAAQARVEQLRAAADAQQGQAPFQCIVDDTGLEGVVLRVIAWLDLGLLGVQDRLDIVSPCDYHSPT